MFRTIAQIVGFITVIQLILFSLFLFSVRRKKINHLILNAFLIVNALFILNFLIYGIEQFFNISLINFRYFGFSAGFLFGPLLYFFTRSLIIKDFRIGLKDSLHLLPFIIYSTILFFAYHIHSEEVKLKLLNSNAVLSPLVSNMNLALFHLQILCYMTASILLINRYQKELKNVYSAIEDVNLSWLKLILFGFIFMWLLDSSKFIISRFTVIPQLISQVMTFLSLTINFLFASFLFLKALRHPELFYFIEQKQPKKKYESSNLSKEESEKYLAEITSFMNYEKPYRIPSLTVNSLSEKIEIKPRLLSQVINENLNQNFFDFINSYRIKEAQAILSEPANKKTILEILYEVGFNSKSVFNTAFKKHTGLTPSQFKKQIANSSIPTKVA